MVFKEPFPTTCLLNHLAGAAVAHPPGPHDYEYYGGICVATVRDVDGVETRFEWDQLNSQGVSRFMGFLRVMTLLGIVAPADPNPEEGSEIVQLGAQQQKIIIMPSTDWVGLRRFVEGIRSSGSLPACENVKDIAKNDEHAATILRKCGQPLGAGNGSYVHPFIRRKRLRSMLLSLGDEEASKYWDGWTIRDLEDVVPDMGAHIATLGRKTLVSTAVQMFGLSPGVGALLIPMAACFWKGALDQNAALAETLAKHPTVLGRALSQYRQRHGINCNVGVLRTAKVTAEFVVPLLAGAAPRLGRGARTTFFKAFESELPHCAPPEARRSRSRLRRPSAAGGETSQLQRIILSSLRETAALSFVCLFFGVG